MPKILIPIPSSEKKARKMFSRAVYSGIVVILTFIVVCVASVLSLRPVLFEARGDIQLEWKGFEELVRSRNEHLPKFTEAFKRHFSGYNELCERLLHARTAIERSSGPEGIATAYVEQEQCLVRIESIVSSRSDLLKQSSFRDVWMPVHYAGREIRLRRMCFNNAIRSYNRLLNGFPQDILAPFFGFFPLSEHPNIAVVGVGQERLR